VVGWVQLLPLTPCEPPLGLFDHLRLILQNLHFCLKLLGKINYHPNILEKFRPPLPPPKKMDRNSRWTPNKYVLSKTEAGSWTLFFFQNALLVNETF
jgi:hypothetical protein